LQSPDQSEPTVTTRIKDLIDIIIINKTNKISTERGIKPEED
jgi:hypothetical protein